MQFSIYQGQDSKQTNIYNFYGLNRTRKTSKGEFEDMRNMGTLEYPCAAPRGPRSKITETTADIVAAVAPDSTNVDEVTGLTGIMGTAFYYNGTRKGASDALPAGYDYEIIRMGNLYIINGYKDNESVMYTYNIDTDTFAERDSGKRMGDLIVASGNDEGGSYLETFRYGFDAVYNYTATDSDTGKQIKNADFFDTYGNPVVPLPNIFSRKFSVGDQVTISGFPTTAENFGQMWQYISNTATVLPQPTHDYSINNTIDTDLVADLDELYDTDIVEAYVKGFDTRQGSVDGTTYYVHKIYFDLYNKNGDPVQFTNMTSDTTNTVYCSGVTVSRRTRTFTHIGTHNNRLWGSIPTGNNIYISTSDDIFDFTSDSIVDGIAARIASDTPGVFTGFAEYGSEMAAFKEDSITVIYGSEPSTYSTSIISGIGCIDPHSIQVTPSGVIFLAYHGFYIFTGGVPSCISSKVNTKYKSAVSGFDGNIYYAAAVREDGTRELLTYDMRYGTWHIQDDIAAVGMFRFRSEFYIADSRDIYRTDAEAGGVDWSFTGVRTWDYTLDSKAVNEIWIKAEITPGAKFIVSTAVDDGEFREHTVFVKPGLHIYRCPVRALTGESYRYKITGTGKVVFYEIELERDTGGRRYKDAETTAQTTGKKYNTIETY